MLFNTNFIYKGFYTSCLIFTTLFQTYGIPIGGRVAGLAGISTNVHDISAVFANPAEIGSITQITCMGYYENRWGLADLSTLATGYVMPIHTDMGIGINISRFGGSLYHEHRIGLSWGHRIGYTNIGVGADLLQRQVANEQARYTIRVHAGGTAQWYRLITCSAYITQLDLSMFGRQSESHIPLALLTGIKYTPYSSVSVFVELEKEANHPSRLKTGIDYKLTSYFSIRMGLCQSPFYISGGLGLNIKQLVIDIASTYHPVSLIGWIHHTSLIYIWKK